MNAELLQAVAEVLVVAIPLVVVGVGGLLLLSRSRLGEALARRIAGDAKYSGYQEQLDALQDELAGLRTQLSDTQERVDFAERLLSRAAGETPSTPAGPRR